MSRGLGVGSMTVSITQRIEWDMGHRLGDGYPSKCRHAHGHRYVAEVSFTAPDLDRYGMVVDFGNIKRLCKTWIDDNIDHAFLVYDKDPSLLAFLRAEDNRHHVVSFNTTAENIATWLVGVLQRTIDTDAAIGSRGIQVTRLKLHETPNGWAEWVADAQP